ncbi:hypothetical protein BDZ85DRAFT_274122 [Elsinoe ampelina]|uniref:AB hydrolase-1 domain-containing protein n=1 Tax=Elsinoe ampelina TaxID=302913 RepID=A0A6A6GC63_9PEZI|nr:hypothetical protein BDZ85DRAFT_274122 [Elsinoe ampelina]
MFGTRWVSLLFDKLAGDCGVRLICVDRPGFGGSTPVPLELRMNVWLETVPALLDRLQVEHVALLTHSAGAVYTLNTLIHHRRFLDPVTPFVGFIAPYVPFTLSGAHVTSALSHLPTGMIDGYAGLTTFVRKNIVPSAVWSGSIVSSCAAYLTPRGIDNPEGQASTMVTPSKQYGSDEETSRLIEKLSTEYQLAENNTGANEEAKLCLRKCDDAAWGDAADYKGCIGKITANEASQRSQATLAKLRIESFFAASDLMVAKGGQTYFEQCWRDQNTDSLVEFESSTVPDTDHDSVLADLRKGAVRTIFERIAGLHAAGQNQG